MEEIKSFQVSGEGSSAVAYLKGSDLILRNLSTDSEKTFSNVTEYVLTKDGELLAYADNGGFSIANVASGETKPIVTGKGRYSKLVWDASQTHLAFLVDASKLHIYDRAGNTAHVAVEAPSKSILSERAPLQFSRDGSRLFFSTAAAPAESKPKLAGEQVVADLWHYKDAFIQPMQKVRSAQERDRSYRAVYHLGEKRFVQLAGLDLPSLIPSPDGRFAIGADDRGYRAFFDYDEAYVDLYLVDTESGKRRKLFTKSAAGRGSLPAAYWSPDGEKVLYFREGNWQVITVADGLVRNITASVPVKFFSETEDRPQTPFAYGTAGWTKDSKHVLLYDRYDVWQISNDARVFAI